MQIGENMKTINDVPTVMEHSTHSICCPNCRHDITFNIAHPMLSDPVYLLLMANEEAEHYKRICLRLQEKISQLENPAEKLKCLTEKK